uniref:ATP synthase complex subunit 8 n=1 Tax=Staphylinidae sp. BMNH 1274658 TaxID=1796587 RepID=A0A126TE89_9COLE|nr:ATP synthase F0 subunit 8 [Staphylinidae sp. BMNH 1274658]
MPQMAPMNWISLLLMFIFIFMMFNSLNYFSFMYKPKKFKISFNKPLISWKW